MMLQLMKNQCKREEFASECARWKKAAEQRIKNMQAQTEALMTLVHDSNKAESLTIKLLASVPQVKLVQVMD